jgi:hypothetical protein
MLVSRSLVAVDSRVPYAARWFVVRALGVVYRYWMTLVFLAVIVQIAAAAYGAFYAAQKLGDQKGSNAHKLISEKVFDHGFGFHIAFGYIIFLGAVVLLLLALAARLGKRRVLFALAVPVAVAVQIVLAWVSQAHHAVGPLHGLNALVLFALTGYMTSQAWRGRPAAASRAAPPVMPASLR